MEKRIKSGRDILYLLQDMQSFELYGTVKAVVSVCDSINYIKDDAELTEVFKLVNNYLDPQGIFIFDFNTEYKYREILGERVIAEEREECSFIWENYYRAEDKMNEYQLTLFVQSQEDPDLYRRYQEVHRQKAYTLEKIKTLIEKAGLRDYSVERLLLEDERNHTELYHTLKTYLLCENNVTAAAKRLHIHRNTLVYRLKQIKECIDVDMNDFEVSRELLAFIMMYDIAGKRLRS